VEGKKEVKEGNSEQMRQKKITEIHSQYIQNKERHEKMIVFKNLSGFLI
jgi:hypothetical protein